MIAAKSISDLEVISEASKGIKKRCPKRRYAINKGTWFLHPKMALQMFDKRKN